MNPELKRYAMVITGRVQGVGYRYFTQDNAERLGLTGWVRNCCYNGDVEGEAQGPEYILQEFFKELKKGPRMGYVTDIRITEKEVTPGEKDFTVRF